ncbi:MAG TPA: N-formylglutamate amidohydrolase [Ohtaekwangia sp.]|nr:N-formylglutamate amidohydrolase [Ohtaekwangia sp.]
MEPFIIQNGRGTQVPIIVSVPHCGTLFPDELKQAYKAELISAPDDTDWFVDQLYDFSIDMGITMIKAAYSRWVIDLNRDRHNLPLYSDGRIITGLCPVTTFLGEPLYRDERTTVDNTDLHHRLTRYYDPYHHALERLLFETKQKFGKVLLWDCHSIRQEVRSIYPNKFPDLILGDNDAASASPILIQTALETLSADQYSFSHNNPFKGGFITRHYGNPLKHQHALQLEMSKVNYMDDEEKKYDVHRAGKMKAVLKRTFEKIIAALNVD